VVFSPAASPSLGVGHAYGSVEPGTRGLEVASDPDDVETSHDAS